MRKSVSQEAISELKMKNMCRRRDRKVETKKGAEHKKNFDATFEKSK